MLEGRWIRAVLLLLTTSAAGAPIVGLWRDSQNLTSIGTSLSGREAALDGKVLHAVGGVLEHLAFRTRVHAGVAVLVLVLLLLLTMRPGASPGRVATRRA